VKKSDMSSPTTTPIGKKRGKKIDKRKKASGKGKDGAAMIISSRCWSGTEKKG